MDALTAFASFSEVIDLATLDSTSKSIVGLMVG
jgi:hypothetical protein